MDSLANYDSDGENSNNSVEFKMINKEKYNARDRSTRDVNYDPVQMDMSEDSNNNNSSGDSGSDGTRSPTVSHHSSTTSKSDSARTRTSSSDKRRSDHDSNTSNSRGESKRTERNDRTRNNDDKCKHSSSDNKRQRDLDSRDTKKSRDDERKSRDDDRRRDRNLSSSSRDDRKEDRDRSDKDHHHSHHHHRDDRRERHRDRDRRHSRTDRTKERHREERSSSRHKEKDRVRSRSRSKERAPLPFRSMSYREEKSRNKLAQLEKLGIELKAPEGTVVTPVSLSEQNYYNPLSGATQGKYAEQIQKRKLLWANKKKQEDSKAPTTVIESTASTWIGTTFTHDQDGKMTAKFKRLMGIKGDVPAVPPPGQKPDILKKQEEMFSNMEQQYEVARATTHTQRGVGLGYASSGYQFPR
ncbi:hypothetical protein PV327_004574 [Microctonus hyperodae]|uniref:Small acidic protein-like domain-containing protein n=1 Tax=Microctonus hyperodae TaxID=165561 RepID=A0AA39KMN4_MICHY|nr:hypothetical protein PV327_004574 [Microctonus hyperodae]